MNDPNSLPETPRAISSSYDAGIIARRWIGAWVDFAVLAAILLGADLLLGNDLYQKTIVVWIAVIIAYFPVLEGLTGRTLGKYLTRTVVVTEAGGLPGFGEAIVRTLLRLLEVNPFLAGGIPAGLVVNFSKTHQRLGDMASGTYVLTLKDARRVWDSVGTERP